MKFSLRNIVSLVFFVPVCLSAQTKIYSPYLLPSYQESVASSKRGLPLKELFNYNCQSQRMEFKSGEDILELADINNVDTLYLGTHKMVPYASRFLDVVYKSPSFSILADYKLRRINKGKTGALGFNTHVGGVDNVDLSYLGGNNLNREQKNLEVWEYEPEHSYMLFRKNKLQSFRNQKTLTKLFPNKKDFIDQYLKEHKINFDNKEEVIELVKQCMTP